MIGQLPKTRSGPILIRPPSNPLSARTLELARQCAVAGMWALSDTEFDFCFDILDMDGTVIPWRDCLRIRALARRLGLALE